MALCQGQVDPEPISIEELLREATVASVLDDPVATDTVIPLVPVEIAATVPPLQEQEIPEEPVDQALPLRQRLKLRSRNRPPIIRPRPVVQIQERPEAEETNNEAPQGRRANLFNSRRRFRPALIQSVAPKEEVVSVSDEEEDTRPRSGGRASLFAPRRRFRPRPRTTTAPPTLKPDVETNDATTATPSNSGRRTFTGFLRRPRPTSQILTGPRSTTAAPEEATLESTTTAPITTTDPAVVTTTLDPVETTTYEEEYYTTEQPDSTTPSPASFAPVNLVVQNPRVSPPPQTFQPAVPTLFNPFSSVPLTFGSTARQPFIPIPTVQTIPVRFSPTARQPVVVAEPQATIPVRLSGRRRVQSNRGNSVPTPFKATTARQRVPEPEQPTVPTETLETTPAGVPLTTRQRTLAAQRATTRFQPSPSDFPIVNELSEIPRSIQKGGRRKGASSARRRRPGSRKRKPVPRIPVEEPAVVETVALPEPKPIVVEEQPIVLRTRVEPKLITLSTRPTIKIPLQEDVVEKSLPDIDDLPRFQPEAPVAQVQEEIPIRRIDPTASSFQQPNTVVHNVGGLPRKFQVTKPSKRLREGDRVRTIDRYKIENEDGSITWGYKSADGSFKEETIGADCVTKGR